jgi:hypothetical protein
MKKFEFEFYGFIPSYGDFDQEWVTISAESEDEAWKIFNSMYRYVKAAKATEVFEFTFKTIDDYYKAERTGYIDDFKIVRIKVANKDGGWHDYPIKSEEEYYIHLKELKDRKAQIIEVYPTIHYYDIQEYD